MRVLIQRVSHACVRIDGSVVGEIGPGLALLVGICDQDTLATVPKMAKKITNMRIFNDDQDKMNLALGDVGGGILLVSQFTLYGDCRKGNRPSFIGSASGEQARSLYAHFGRILREAWSEVSEGEFGAMMRVELVNDGPVTLVIDREAPGPLAERGAGASGGGAGR